jgi:hypothetical protein
MTASRQERPFGNHVITLVSRAQIVIRGHVYEKTLRGAAYDYVVIGGGLRIPPKSLALFEMVVNHKAAPAATIALNTCPEDTAEAAARQLNPR